MINEEEEALQRAENSIIKNASSYEWMNDKLRSSKFVPRYAEKQIKVLAFIPEEMKYDKTFLYSIKHLLSNKQKEIECNHQNFIQLKENLDFYLEQDLRRAMLSETLTIKNIEVRHNKPRRKI